MNEVMALMTLKSPYEMTFLCHTSWKALSRSIIIFNLHNTNMRDKTSLDNPLLRTMFPIPVAGYVCSPRTFSPIPVAAYAIRCHSSSTDLEYNHNIGQGKGIRKST